MEIVLTHIAYSKAASGRNENSHQLNLASAQRMGLTPGGLVIHARTRRPVATCNAIAEIIGIGPIMESAVVVEPSLDELGRAT